MTKEEALEVLLGEENLLRCPEGSCGKCFNTCIIINPRWVEATLLINPMSDQEALRILRGSSTLTSMRVATGTEGVFEVKSVPSSRFVVAMHTLSVHEMPMVSLQDLINIRQVAADVYYARNKVKDQAIRVTVAQDGEDLVSVGGTVYAHEAKREIRLEISKLATILNNIRAEYRIDIDITYEYDVHDFDIISHDLSSKEEAAFVSNRILRHIMKWVKGEV